MCYQALQGVFKGAPNVWSINTKILRVLLKNGIHKAMKVTPMSSMHLVGVCQYVDYKNLYFRSVEKTTPKSDVQSVSPEMGQTYRNQVALGPANCLEISPIMVSLTVDDFHFLFVM